MVTRKKHRKYSDIVNSDHGWKHYEAGTQSKLGKATCFGASEKPDHSWKHSEAGTQSKPSKATRFGARVDRHPAPPLLADAAPAAAGVGGAGGAELFRVPDRRERNRGLHPAQKRCAPPPAANLPAPSSPPAKQSAKRREGG